MFTLIWIYIQIKNLNIFYHERPTQMEYLTPPCANIFDCVCLTNPIVRKVEEMVCGSVLRAWTLSTIVQITY